MNTTKIQTLKGSSVLFFVKMLGGSLAIAALANIAIPLPFTPIPFTLQTLGLYLVASQMSGKMALGCLALYLAEGLMGFPVFAGGMSGLPVLLSPRGGYLVGFLVAAFLIGLGSQKWPDSSFFKRVALYFMGEVAILSFGFLGMLFFFPPKEAFLMGVAPFIFMEASKVVLAAFLSRGLRRSPRGGRNG